MTQHITNLLNAIKYYYDTPRDREKEVGAFLTPLRSKYPRKFYDNMSNDIRHAYASAVLARDKGEGVAKFLGDANEAIDYGASGRYDTERDLEANALGRSYATMYPDFNNQQMLEQIYKDYLKKNYW